VIVSLKRIKIVFVLNQDLFRSVPKVKKYEIACQLWILIVFSLRMGISCRLLTFALHLITVITWLKNLPGCPIVSPFLSHPALFLPASLPFSISITAKQWTHMWVFVFWLSWNRVKTQMPSIFHMPMLETEKKFDSIGHFAVFLLYFCLCPPISIMAQRESETERAWEGAPKNIKKNHLKTTARKKIQYVMGIWKVWKEG